MNLDITDWIIIALVTLAVALLLWEHVATRSREIDERLADELEAIDHG
jgi:hypothetical protein